MNEYKLWAWAFLATLAGLVLIFGTLTIRLIWGS